MIDTKEKWISSSSAAELLRAARWMPGSKQRIDDLRAVAANMGLSDRNPIKQAWIERVEKVARGELERDELNRMRKEMLKTLEHYYENDCDKDPSYAGMMEANYRPLEELCDVAVSWSKLCDVADRILSSTLRYQG